MRQTEHRRSSMAVPQHQSLYHQQPSPNFHSGEVVDTAVSPHLRHNHHHHPNNSATTSFTNFSIQHPKHYFENTVEGSDSSDSVNSDSLISNIISTTWGQNSSLNFNNSSSNFTTFPNNSTSFPFKHYNSSISDGGETSGGSYFSPDFTGLVSSSQTNLSLTEMESMYNIYNNSTFLNTSTGSVNVTFNPPPYMSTLYSIIVPVMIFFCVLTCLVNLIIVLSARWCRKPMSPTLYFSISLALADAYAAFTLGIGLVINSYLPKVYGIHFSACISLTIEALRMGGVLVTVCHLLALGINHWIGIVRPLHYAATMTRRTAWIVIILSWICPILMLFIYYSSVSGEGFLIKGCTNCAFIQKRTYRGFFASCFFAPLFLMSLIYIHIFLIVRSHHSNRLRYQVKKKSCQALRKNVKAVLTTVLILGTYIIGWMPATLFNIIACEDCIIKLAEIPSGIKVTVGITVNFLVILKVFVDPIIYAARMSDIQLSLKKMRYDFLQLFCKSCVHALPPPDQNDRGFSKFNRSLYDTKSVRMSSFGSSSSSRRTATAAAANLINNSPGAQNNHNNKSCTGFNNSINYKHQNGNGNSSPNLHHHSHLKSQLIHKTPTFEMTELR